MIWFNLKELERKLIQYELSENAAFQYLLVIMILITLAFYAPGVKGYTHYAWEIGDVILELLITVVGIYTLYSVNSKGDNRDFLKRYFSLSFVVGLRLLIFYLAVRLIFKIIMFVIPLDLWYSVNDLLSEDVREFIFSTVFSLIFYWLLVRSFKRINSHRRENKKELQSNLD